MLSIGFIKKKKHGLRSWELLISQLTALLFCFGFFFSCCWVAVFCHIISGPFTIRIIFLSVLRSQSIIGRCIPTSAPASDVLIPKCCSSSWMCLVRWCWLFFYNSLALPVVLTARHKVYIHATVPICLSCNGTDECKCTCTIIY